MSQFQKASNAIYNALFLKKSLERKSVHPDTVESYEAQMQELALRYPDDLSAQMAAQLGHTGVMHTQQLERASQMKRQLTDLLECLDDPKGCLALMAALAEQIRYQSPEDMAEVFMEDPDALDILSEVQPKLAEARDLAREQAPLEAASKAA